MAQNQKSFENKKNKNKFRMLLGASALAMSLTTTNAMATDYGMAGGNVIINGAAGGNVANLQTGQAAVANNALVNPATFFFNADNQTITLTSTVMPAGRLGDTADNVITFNPLGHAGTVVIANEAVNSFFAFSNNITPEVAARAAAANAATLPGLNADATGELRFGVLAAAQNHTVTDVSSLGLINFADQDATVTLRHENGVMQGIISGNAAGGANKGTVVVNANMKFEGAAFDQQFKSLQANAAKTITINADLGNIGTGVVLKAAGSKLIINDGKNILATATSITALVANEGVLTFEGASNVNVPILGTAANPLAQIIFRGDNTKTVDMQAGANAIFTVSAVFEGDSTLKLSGAATTLTLGTAVAGQGKGSITTLTDGQGNIHADGAFAHVINGNVGTKDLKLGDIKIASTVNAADGLSIITAPSVAAAGGAAASNGVIAITTISGDADADLSSLKLQSGNGDVNGIVDIYVNGKGDHAANVTLAGNSNALMAAKFNLKENSHLVANNFLMNNAADNQANKLVLENGSTLEAVSINSSVANQGTIIIGTKDNDIATIVTDNIGNFLSLDTIKFSNHDKQKLTIKKAVQANHVFGNILAKIDFFDKKSNILEVQDSYILSGFTNANKSNVQVNGYDDKRIVQLNLAGHADADNGAVLGTLDIQQGTGRINATVIANNYVKQITINNGANLELTSALVAPTTFKNMKIISDETGSIYVQGDKGIKLDKTFVIKNTAAVPAVAPAVTPATGVLKLASIGFKDAGANSAIMFTKENFGGATALQLSEYITTNVDNNGSIIFNNLGSFTVSSTKDGLTQNGDKLLKDLILIADDNATTDLTFASDYYSKGMLGIAKNSSMTLSASNYSFDSIQADAADSAGILKFDNQDADTNVTLYALVPINLVDNKLSNLNFAAGNVVITSKTPANASLTSKKIEFSGIKENTVTLPAIFSLNDVDVVVTAKDKTIKHTIIVTGGEHRLKATDKDSNLVFSTNIIDTKFSVGENVYGQVTNETAGHARITIVANDAGVAPKNVNTIVGSVDKKLLSVDFGNFDDLTIQKGVYSQNATIHDGKKAIFSNKNTYVDGLMTQYGNIVDKLTVGKGSTSVHGVDSGFKGNTSFIENNNGQVEFKGNNTYSGNIGTVALRAATIASSSTTTNSTLKFDGNIFSNNLDTSKESLILTGNALLDVTNEMKLGNNLDLNIFKLTIKAPDTALAYKLPTNITLDYGKGNILVQEGKQPTIDTSNIILVNLQTGENANTDDTTDIFRFTNVNRVDELKNKYTIKQSANAYITVKSVVKLDNTDTVLHLIRESNAKQGMIKDLTTIAELSDPVNTALKTISDNKSLSQNVGALPDKARPLALAKLVTGQEDAAVQAVVLNSNPSNLISARLNKLHAAESSGDEDSDVAFGAWISPTMSSTTQKLDGLTFGYEMKNYGATVGFDSTISDNAVLGVQFTYGKTTINFKDIRDGDTSDVQNLSFGVYSSYNLSDDVFAAMDFNVSTNEVKSSELNIVNTAQVTTAKYDLNTLSGGFKLGYNAKISDLIFTPTVGVEALGLSHKEYKQTNSTLVNKSFAKDDGYTINGVLGTKIAYNIDAGSDTIVTPDLHGSVKYKFASKALENKFTLAGATDQITPYVADDSKLTSIVGAGININVAGQFNFGGQFDYTRYNSNLSAIQGTLNLRANF